MKEYFKFGMCMDDATEYVGSSLLSEKLKDNSMKMKKIQKAVQWVIWSSANKQAVSLTIKSFVACFVLLGVDSQVSNDLADGLVEFWVALGIVFSASLTLFGLIRKLWLTLK